MKQAIEYRLAEALTEHLRGDAELAPAVLPEPFDRADQCQAIALAAGQYDFAVAVEPLPLQLPTDATDRTGVVEVRLAVHVLTTQQLNPQGFPSAGALAAAVMGRVLACCMRWRDEVSAGIPYADPVPESVAELDLSKFDALANLSGQALIIARKVNLRDYYRKR